MHAPSPIDLPEPEIEANALGWTCVVVAIAALFLLAANAVSLRDWIDEQPPSPFQAQAATLADQWVEFTGAIGIGLPRDAIHTQWKRAEGARFHEGAGENEAASGPANQR
ncbi:MAG TPA: hypothetical protein VNT42_12015 [Sphingomonas sp.]|nr:hypothetical protein [Sphingomonas sp.]